MPNKLLLSCLEIRFSAQQFDAVEAEYPGDEAFEQLRERTDIFVYRRGDGGVSKHLLVIPMGSGATGFPKPTSLPIEGNLGVLAALLSHRLPNILAQLKRPMKLTPRRRRGFRGLRGLKQSDDLVARTFKRLGTRIPEELQGFHKYGKMDFQVRVLETCGRDASLGLTVELRRHLKVDPNARELLDRGLDLRGIWMIDPQADDERILGPVTDVDDVDLLVQGPDNVRRLDASKCHPEPSLATFATIFDRVLQPAAREIYEDTEWLIQAETTSGDGYKRRLIETASYFQDAGELQAAPSVSFRFGPLIEAGFEGKEPSAVTLPPVIYCFSSDRNKTHEYPASGLSQFGPFDNRTFDKKSPRMLVVAPEEHRGETDGYVRKLLEGVSGGRSERFAKGLIGTYLLSKAIPQYVSVTLPRSESIDIGSRYVAAIRDALDPAKLPDVALVFLRDRDAFSDRDNPYLAAKAYLLGQGVPTQEIRLETVRKRYGFAYSLENIAAAVYAKLGGSPWTVLPTMPIAHEVVLGMGLAEVGGRFAARKRYVGITTIFRSDGTYLLAAASPRCTYEEYPHVLTQFIEGTIRRLAADQSWQEGDLVRLVFHARQRLKKTDIGAIVTSAVRQLKTGIHFEASFLTIHKDHPFKIIAPHEQGRKKFVEVSGDAHEERVVGICVPARGTVVDLGNAKRLLCVNGPLLVKREGEPIPQPLLIELHPDSKHRDIDSLVRQIYHFTGLSWRSMLPVGEPVTTYYSHLIADLLGRLDAVPDWSDTLLDTRLRRSRWFL